MEPIQLEMPANLDTWGSGRQMLIVAHISGNLGVGRLEIMDSWKKAYTTYMLCPFRLRCVYTFFRLVVNFLEVSVSPTRMLLLFVSSSRWPTTATMSPLLAVTFTFHNAPSSASGCFQILSSCGHLHVETV
ncbi:unnamed protein product [Protopolystoma xenopodis]|uniref:Uncharacterized protein n=1 Tax=Protopolystoma xenopodis TaxID=117903 RepID=A0A448XFH5_9PLAT|nr:unnamed protein product [Protopolystoma xenopodis]